MVSSLGRVRGPRSILKPFIHKGYCKVGMSGGMRMACRQVHRLVLEAFVGPCPDGYEAAHNDGDPLNNRLDNLRWDTKIANHADKLRHGTQYRGAQVYNAKLTDDDVRCIRAEPDGHGTGQMLATAFDVSKAHISRLRLDYVGFWPHITEAVVCARAQLQADVGV